jgi:superfamily II DNA or RNA helicase
LSDKPVVLPVRGSFDYVVQLLTKIKIICSGFVLFIADAIFQTVGPSVADVAAGRTGRLLRGCPGGGWP